MLGSYWQSKTYELLISEPDKEFLLLLELYIDKTGENLALQSYCGKPMIWSMPLLTQSFQQKQARGGQWVLFWTSKCCRLQRRERTPTGTTPRTNHSKPPPYTHKIAGESSEMSAEWRIQSLCKDGRQDPMISQSHSSSQGDAKKW